MVYSAYSAGKGSRHSVGHGDTLGKRHLGPPTIFAGGIGVAPSLAVVGPRTRLGVNMWVAPKAPAGMAEGNRETFGPRVGLSSHGSPAKGGPKSKCLPG